MRVAQDRLVAPKPESVGGPAQGAGAKPKLATLSSASHLTFGARMARSVCPVSRRVASRTWCRTAVLRDCAVRLRRGSHRVQPSTSGAPRPWSCTQRPGVRVNRRLVPTRCACWVPCVTARNAMITAAWPEDLPHAAGSWRRPQAGLLWGGVPGEQRDENLGVGAAPAGDGIPAGYRPVAGDRFGRELHGVASLGDVVEGLLVVGAAGDLVDGRVNEAQMAPGVLVGQGDERGPDRGAGAGAAAVADHGPTVVTQDEGHAGVASSVGGHVGHSPGGPDARGAVLVARPGEQAAEPAAGCLEGRSRVAIRQVPGGLSLPRAGGVAGGQAGAAGA